MAEKRSLLVVIYVLLHINAKGVSRFCHPLYGHSELKPTTKDDWGQVGSLFFYCVSTSNVTALVEPKVHISFVMALQVYRYANYLTTDEREQFRSLCKLLSKSKDDYILVANPIIGGRELDALLIKRDAIIVLEFKNYTGSLTASEFGDWHITTDEGTEVVVKGGFGNKNPYVQVNHNKWSVVNKFKDELNSPLVNAYHVSGIVVFKGNITENNFNFSPKVRTWFRIADMTNIIEVIENIASPKIDFNDALWNELPKFLNVEDYIWTDYEQTSSEISVNNNKEVEACQDEKVLAEESSLSVRNEKDIKSIIIANGFKICKEKREGKRDAKSVSYSDLNLSKQSIDFLKGKDINTLWEHQYLAIKKAKKGKNLCITTSTSSGKTEIFQIIAIEKLKESPDSKILAIYPMKALNRQQLERWEKTGFKVGKIDGDVTDSEVRKSVLQNSQIVVVTPDVMHAFLLGRLNDKTVGEAIQNFIKNVSLIIIDELHLFKGVFGTNSAYLFRRFNNIRRLLRKGKGFAQYITASATLPNAIEHSFNITGVTGFEEIGIQQDASPVAEKIFYFIEPDDDEANEINMVCDFSTVDDAKSITFVEGRQRAGEMAYVAGQKGSGIYPYRAGYEIESVNIITEKLNKGDFKGIISTSALEIGIDIDGLNIAIIADMPYDKNSYMQRIGRVGRFGCEKSYVIVVKTNSFASQLLFDERKYNYNIDQVLPDYEPALYLEDKTVQNIHALCHVGDTDYCEYAKWRKEFNKVQQFDDGGCFPASFAKLCQGLLTGQEISGDYEEKARILEGAPQMAYPLRFFSDTYKILPTKGERNFIPRENITRDQIRTEGYEGAVRNTWCKGEHILERVRYINFPKREIYVAREWNNYLSTSLEFNKYIIPNFHKDFRYRTIYFGDAKIFNLRVNELYYMYGYRENHNKKSEYFRYKSSDGDAKILRMPPFNTTGVVLFHPSLNVQKVDRCGIATILFEVFLRLRAFERSDINYGADRLFNGNDLFKRGDNFVAIYDANDLNLTSRALDEHLLKQIFEYIADNMEVLTASVCPNITPETVAALNDLCQSVLTNEADLTYKDLGKEHKFKKKTEVIYRMPSKEDPEVFNEYKCIYLGKDEDGTYIILLNGEPKFDIPADCIEPTENTEYE